MNTSKSLVGRQVYFKMSAAKYEKIGNYLKPNTLYTIIRHPAGSNLAEIRNNIGTISIIKLTTCAHLNDGKWILKRLPKTK